MGKAGRPRAMYHARLIAKYVRKSSAIERGERYAAKEGRKSEDVTRSSVQKSVVVIVGEAKGLGELRTRLGMVTQMWFEQEDFSDTDILKSFQESLWEGRVGEGDNALGISFRVLYCCMTDGLQVYLSARSSTNFGIRLWSWSRRCCYRERYSSLGLAARGSVFYNLLF